MIPYGDMLKGSFDCQQLQVSSIVRDVNYSCGSCGYELNLNSSNRNTGLIDSKSIKRGIISFFSVDESRFTQIHQLPWSFWIPFFNSKRQQRTKLLCRNCASHLGFAYTLPSQSQSWDGISDDSRIYDIKTHRFVAFLLRGTISKVRGYDQVRECIFYCGVLIL